MPCTAPYLQQINRSLIKLAYRIDVLPDETASRAWPKCEDAGTVIRAGAGQSVTVEDILPTDAAPPSLYGDLYWVRRNSNANNARRIANWANKTTLRPGTSCTGSRAH